MIKRSLRVIFSLCQWLGSTLCRRFKPHGGEPNNWWQVSTLTRKVHRRKVSDKWTMENEMHFSSVDKSRILQIPPISMDFQISDFDNGWNADFFSYSVFEYPNRVFDSEAIKISSKITLLNSNVISKRRAKQIEMGRQNRKVLGMYSWSSPSL